MNIDLKQHKQLCTGKKIAGARRPLLALVFVMLFTIATPVQAAPQIPYQVYGNVFIDGQPAPAGLSITACIGGTPYVSTVTNASGHYGYDPEYFRIPADNPETPAVEGGINGQIVELYVEDIVAGTSEFSSGAIRRVNIVISGDGGVIQPGTKPNAPGNFTATASAYNEIILFWADNSNDEDGFRIARSTDGSSFYTVKTAPANSTSYKDTSVDGGTLYYYIVRAFNSAGDSTIVGPISITSLNNPAKPTPDSSKPELETNPLPESTPLPEATSSPVSAPASSSIPAAEESAGNIPDAELEASPLPNPRPETNQSIIPAQVLEDDNKAVAESVLPPALLPPEETPQGTEYLIIGIIIAGAIMAVTFIYIVVFRRRRY